MELLDIYTHKTFVVSEYHVFQAEVADRTDESTWVGNRGESRNRDLRTQCVP